MTTAYAERERDPEYMAWVKRQPCLLAHLGDCDGVVEADHAGEHPYGHKPPDDTCIPLCTKHHRDRTDSTGFFRAPTRADKFRRRRWLDGAIAQTQERHRRNQLDNSMIPF